MAHFTYCDPDTSILKQGDVIKKNDTILNIIKEVHPYFSSDNYSHFLILTQSCDLVKRDSEKCKSKYITISAIRPLDECLKREARPYLKSIIEKRTEKILDEKNKNKIRDTLEKLLNNNHPDYFYLHESVEHGLTNSLVTFLRVSIALKSEMHYDSLLTGKILELKEEFKAKLGWLVGNLYSRVGTEDWVPALRTKTEFNDMLNNVLNANFYWINNLSEIEKNYKNQIESEIISGLDVNAIVEKIASYKIESKKDQALRIIGRILEENNIEGRERIVNKLRNDGTFMSLIK